MPWNTLYLWNIVEDLRKGLRLAAPSCLLYAIIDMSASLSYLDLLYIYIYIYIEREREIDITYMCVRVYTYTHTHIHTQSGCQTCTVLFVLGQLSYTSWELGRPEKGELPRTASKLPRTTLWRGLGAPRLLHLLWSNTTLPLEYAFTFAHALTFAHAHRCKYTRMHMRVG